MATVFSILSLPKTSNGFTSLRPTSGLEDDLPHKVARSYTDGDSATAFRSKRSSSLNENRKGPIQIQVVGEFSMYFVHILASYY